jgi:hypothetical protein
MKQTNRKPIRRISKHDKKEEIFLERLDKTEFHPFVKNAIALFDSVGDFIRKSTLFVVTILAYSLLVRLLLP